MYKTLFDFEVFIFAYVPTWPIAMDSTMTCDHSCLKIADIAIIVAGWQCNQLFPCTTGSSWQNCCNSFMSYVFTWPRPTSRVGTSLWYHTLKIETSIFVWPYHKYTHWCLRHYNIFLEFSIPVLLLKAIRKCPVHVSTPLRLRGASRPLSLLGFYMPNVWCDHDWCHGGLRKFRPPEVV